MNIAENLQIVLEKIYSSEIRAGRPPGSVKLIAVTKTVPAEKINEAISAGAGIIGENRVNELVQKKDALLPVEKHMIGVLQTNKVKYLIGEAAMIHSVDRPGLLREIARQCAKKDAVMPILLEVRIGGESGKSGVDPGKLPVLVEEALGFPELRLCGLMCVPPPAAGDIARAYFSQLREVFEKIKSDYSQNLQYFSELSMGMSGDFEEAVQEGATFVRVGSAIFGARVR
ncbi:MAG: YggS family pyridoxal phosphate-dependent enzyme [Oscillospiraceae bacterium]|jgi:pyridoxal phosphate enzyme (YggS family)|nr:YggS family pyridoxal phosphate-dependent enzyme [Oscillospiraceae bacterium]